MNPQLFQRMLRHHPAGDDGSDTGGTDTLDTAVLGDEDEQYASLPIEERRRLRGDDAAPEAATTPTSNSTPAEDDRTDADDSAGTTPDKGNGIPRARFNEVNEQRKALQQEVEQLRAQIAGGGQATQGPAQAQAPAFNLQDAEEQYAQLMMDGDTKAAATLRVQINGAIEEAAFARFNQANANERAVTRTQATVEHLLSEFPWLDDPEGAEALELIEASVAMKINRGTPLDQALAEAVRTIAPRFDPDTTPTRVGQGGSKSGDMRVERANRRGAMDSQMQPAALQAGIGNRATPAQIDPTKLSDEEYMNLPEAERKRLRGD